MFENEYLPPGHPLTWDIDVDLEGLKKKHLEPKTSMEG
jgi:acetophenone carboxylase